MIFKTLLYSFFLIVFAPLLSCEKIDDYDVVNLNGNRVGVIGHGGLGFISSTNLIPDNSIRSIRRAINGYGIEGVEVDVQMSQDEEFFLYHDIQLQSKTDCQGSIEERLSFDLDECRYRNSINVRFFDDLFLARLEIVLSEFSSYTDKPLFYLDMRTVSSNNIVVYDSIVNRIAEKVSEMIDRYDAYNWIYIESVDFHFLNILRVTNPRILLIYDGKITIENLDRIIEIGGKGIVSNNSRTTKADVALAHSKGLQVSVFNLKSRSSHIEAIKKNVDFIQTDNVELLISILNQR
jgi:glycerophosphoryl diester phosphodiesterase